MYKKGHTVKIRSQKRRYRFKERGHQKKFHEHCSRAFTVDPEQAFASQGSYSSGMFIPKNPDYKNFLTSLFGFYILNITPWTNSGFVICCYLDFVTREQRQPINNERGFRTAFHIETTKITPRSRHTVINIKPL